MYCLCSVLLERRVSYILTTTYLLLYMCSIHAIHTCDLEVAFRILYCWTPSILDKPLHFAIPVSLARPSGLGHPPSSFGGWIRPVGDAI